MQQLFLNDDNFKQEFETITDQMTRKQFRISTITNVLIIVSIGCFLLFILTNL